MQFERLRGFKNAHLGAFWNSLDKQEWPIVFDAPLLAPQFERFNESAKWAKGLQIQLTQDPVCRLQIKNAAGDRMIQVQNSRLHFNWIGEAGGGYPRYDKVRDGFANVLERFRAFVSQADVGDFRPNQWEVTYINQTPQGTVWNTFADLEFFQPLRSVPTIENVVEGESFSGEWHFVLPERRGRLHVGLQHGLLSEAGDRQLLQLTMTARGPVDSKDDPATAIFEGLDLGRQTIVQTFVQLMSPDANKYWGLKNAGS